MSHATTKVKQESGFPLSRYDHREYPEAVTQADRFVDDTTLLRMMRFRYPIAKPELGGLTSDTIKQIHLSPEAGRLERWAHPEDGSRPLVDVAFRFADGSLAVRMIDTKRWEVWRTW